MVRFGRTFKRMRIERLRPLVEICRHVVGAELDIPGLTRPDEWIDTRIRFLLNGRSDGTAELSLDHFGLTPTVECYGICTQGWHHFIESLRNYCEIGIGSPFLASTE